MEKTDSVSEILEFAIAREVEANEFYTALAGRVEDPAIQKVFEKLAREELEHKAKLELEVMKIGKVATEPQKRPDAEKLANLKIGEYIVDTGDPLAMHFVDVLILGIKKERVAFRFYVDLAAMIQDADLRETLLLLAEEEARHKVRFEMEYEKVTLKEKW